MIQTLLNNRYRIIRSLGAGGFGETHLAEDIQMPSGRRCVIKQLKPITNDPQIFQLVQERFQREAAILEDLGAAHPQIPSLYAYFEISGQFSLVQEWIDGVTLANRLQQNGNLSESSVKDVLIGILPVLDYVHSKQIVHRDIKPENIILRASDGKPVLIDFGAVRETMATIVTSKGNTSQSIVIGTPGFMSSEQSAGRPVYASDIYSLGLTAIYLLTGKIPQEIETDPRTGEILWRRYALSVTPTFSAILDRAIQSHPRDRYGTPKEMLEALYNAALPIPHTVISAPPPGTSNHQSTVISAPPVGHQPTGFSPPVTVTNSGLGDWQKAAIVGGIIGSFVVAGLFLTRPQPSEPPIASSPTPSASSPPTSSTLQAVQTQTTNNPNQTVTSVPSQQFSSAPVPSISQQEAVNLINNWLQAKAKVFSSPFERSLAANFTTDVLYYDITKPGGSIDWLRANNAFYRFGLRKVESVEQFVTNGDEATIVTTVIEDRTFFVKGKIDKTQTDFTTKSLRYTLKKTDGRWKIADYK
jgi:serine/threonine protein kinase